MLDEMSSEDRERARQSMVQSGFGSAEDSFEELDRNRRMVESKRNRSAGARGLFWAVVIAGIAMLSWRGADGTFGRAVSVVLFLVAGLRLIFGLLRLSVAGTYRKLSEENDTSERAGSTDSAAGPPVPGQPDDSIDPGGPWALISASKVDDYQACFDEMLDAVETNDSAELPDPFSQEQGAALQEIESRYIDEQGLNQFMILTLFYMYVESDLMVRQIVRSYWVRKVTSWNLEPAELFYGDSYFPPPQNVMRYVKQTFYG